MGLHLHPQPASGRGHLLIVTPVIWHILLTIAPFDLKSLKHQLTDDQGSMWVIFYHSVLTKNPQLDVTGLELATSSSPDAYLVNAFLNVMACNTIVETNIVLCMISIYHLHIKY